MSDTITVKTTAPGPGVMREVSPEKLSELDPDQWVPTGEHQKYTVEELAAFEWEEPIEENNDSVQLNEELSRGGPAEGFEMEIMPSKMDSQRLERWFTPEEIEELHAKEAAEEIEQSTSEEPSSLREEKSRMREEWREMQTEAREEDIKSEKLANIYREKDRKSSTSIYSDIAEELESGKFDGETQSPTEELSDVDNLPPEQREKLVEAWSDRGGIWEEFAEEIESHSTDTETFHGGSTKVSHKESGDLHIAELSTSHDGLMGEIRDVSSDSDNLRILKDTGQKMLAEVTDYDSLATELMS